MSNSRLIGIAILASGLVAACANAGTQTAQPGGANVQVGAFDNIELRGGGHITLHYGSAEHVELVQGSTQYTSFRIEDGHKLIIDACDGSCPEHYDLQIEITLPAIKAVAIDGGGHIESAAGFPAQNGLAVAVNGGGHIDLGNVDVENGVAAVHGGGHILIHAKSNLTAAVNGGGSIRYTGDPRVVSAINGGGSIAREGSTD